MSAKILPFSGCDVPDAMAAILQHRLGDLSKHETMECYLCQRAKPECMCGDDRFVAARAIAEAEAKHDELHAILAVLSGTLDDLRYDEHFDPFEDAIGAWHDGGGLNSFGTPVGLPEWLNLTPREYALYVQHPWLKTLLYGISRVRALAHREQIDGSDVRNSPDDRLGNEQP